MKHIIMALVQNQSGVLAHVAGMFAARGFNIDSLVVGRTDDPNVSRMTIVAVGDDRVLEQIRKQLEKIVMLIRIHAPSEKRAEVVELTNLFRGRVVDVARKSLIVEMSGPEDKLEAFIDLVRPYGIGELARTGVIAMKRGTQQGES
jgi:acetolactate synthase-1/3 small subunit